jgi:hypothetical protein
MTMRCSRLSGENDHIVVVKVTLLAADDGIGRKCRWYCYKRYSNEQ